MENWGNNMRKTTDTLTEGLQALKQYYNGDSGGLLGSLSDLLNFGDDGEETSTQAPVRSYPPKPNHFKATQLF